MESNHEVAVADLEVAREACALHLHAFAVYEAAHGQFLKISAYDGFVNTNSIVFPYSTFPFSLSLVYTLLLVCYATNDDDVRDLEDLRLLVWHILVHGVDVVLVRVAAATQV